MWGRGDAPGSLLFQNFPFPSITRQGLGLLIEPGCRGPVSRVYAPGLYLTAKLLRMCPASAAPSPPRPIAAPSGSHLRCSEAEPASGRGQEQAVATGRAWGQPAMPGVTAAGRVSRMSGKFLGLDRTQGGANLPTTSGGRCLSCPQCPRNVEESPPGTGLPLQGHLRTRAPARPRACAEGRWCGWRRAGVGPQAAGPGVPGHTGSEPREDDPAPCSQQRQRKGARFPPKGRLIVPTLFLGFRRLWVNPPPIPRWRHLEMPRLWGPLAWDKVPQTHFLLFLHV